MPAEGIDGQIRACLSEKLYKSAFDLIVTHFSAKVIRLSYSILGNRASAEELRKFRVPKTNRKIVHRS